MADYVSETYYKTTLIKAMEYKVLNGNARRRTSHMFCSWHILHNSYSPSDGEYFP